MMEEDRTYFRPDKGCGERVSLAVTRLCHAHFLDSSRCTTALISYSILSWHHGNGIEHNTANNVQNTTA